MLGELIGEPLSHAFIESELLSQAIDDPSDLIRAYKEGIPIPIDYITNHSQWRVVRTLGTIQFASLPPDHFKSHYA